MGRKKANRQAFKEAGAMLTEAYLQGFSFSFVTVDYVVFTNAQGNDACIVFRHGEDGYGHINQAGEKPIELTAEQARLIAGAAYERQIKNPAR